MQKNIWDAGGYIVYLTHFGPSYPWMFWAGGAGWNIRPLYKYAMIMGDKQYLKKHVLPLYMKMAEFYENYLTFRINEDGTLAEWMDKNYPDVYQHRHNSHLYPVFPRIELIHAVDTALLHAATAALYKRFEFDTSSTHGLIHLALQAIHLKNTHIMELNLDMSWKAGKLVSFAIHAGNDDVCTVVYKDEKKQIAMKKGKTYNQVDLL
ncbi:MAG: hypothetical protein VB098_06545 [Petrimonas sp.]|nr:hypothetical protein [Petrimonas sp.]